MATYTSIINPGLVNAEGENKYLNRLFTPGVAMGITATSLAVGQRGAGANMSVDIAVGDAHLQLPTTAYGLWGWADAVTNLTISAANASLGRVDVIVAWVDTTITTTASANNPGSFKFSAIAGTPSGSPVAVTDTVVQSTLGASVAWVKLGYVFVGAAVSSITTGVITDARVAVSSRFTTSNAMSYVPYKFSVYRSSAYTLANAVLTKMPYDAKTYDTGSNYDATTNFRFTAPVAGFYRFTTAIFSAANTSQIDITLYKNGSAIKHIASAASSGNFIYSASGNATLQLAAGDYIEVWYFIPGGVATSTGAANTFFDGELISTS